MLGDTPSSPANIFIPEHLPGERQCVGVWSLPYVSPRGDGTKQVLSESLERESVGFAGWS